jgi:hypothetical protein
MKRLRYLVPVFVLVAFATMAGSALAHANPQAIPVPEPSTMITFAGLAAVGFAGWLWHWRKRRQ